jgi:alanine-synthesizing transaminase
VSFNVPYRTHFRITNLPDAAVLRTVFSRIEEVLAGYAAAPRSGAEQKVVRADKRFG